MRRAAVVAGTIALLLLVWPEPGRYLAERRLRRGTDAFRSALASPTEDARKALLRSAGELALSAAARLPADPRPRLLAGSVRLLEGKPREALDFYRDALATGERAEIDLNAGRAHALAGELPEAQAALLRALWVSPALAAGLPQPVARRILDEVAKRENDLRAGMLKEPPPLPD